MNITTRKKEAVIILDLEGKLAVGGGDIQFREQAQKALAMGERDILINLQGIKMMDSSGLGELVRMRKAAANLGATVKLLHVEDKVHEVLQMAGLIGVFETFDDEIDAIASFRD